MIRDFIINLFLLITFLVIQSSFLDNLLIFGIIPDLAFTIIFYFTSKNRVFYSQIFGFISGLMYDFVSFYPIGFYCLIFLIISSVLSRLNDIDFPYKNMFFVFLFLLFLNFFKKFIIIILISIFLDSKIEISFIRIIKEIIITSVLNALIIYIINSFSNLFNNKESEI